MSRWLAILPMVALLALAEELQEGGELAGRSLGARGKCAALRAERVHALRALATARA